MNELYQSLLQKIKKDLAVSYEQADANPNMWYEVFITHDDGSTESIGTGLTFEEASKSFLLYCETSAASSLSIDVWQNWEHPEHIASPTPELKEGQLYIIYLKNGRKVYRAIYHHCALSDQHYFAKGDNAYPLEDVISQSMKEREPTSDMPPQILTDDYCGHLIEVTFTSVLPYKEFEQIPDSVYDFIMGELKENSTEGTFDEEDTGDEIYVSEEVDDEYTKTAGSWRVVQIDHRLILRMAHWVRNFGFDERLTKELFAETYGSVMGDHYLEKWESVFCLDIIKMVAYLDDRKDGQKFCNMIYRQMTAYEKRINERK